MQKIPLGTSKNPMKNFSKIAQHPVSFFQKCKKSHEELPKCKTSH